MREAARELADRLHLLRLAQGLLGPGERLGGLLLGLDFAPDRVDEVLVWNSRPRQPAVAAVPAPVAVLEGQLRGAAGQSGRRGEGRLPVVRMDEVHEGPRGHLLGGPTQRRHPCRVQTDDVPVEIRHAEQVGGGLPDLVPFGGALGDLLLQRCVQVAQGLFGRPQLGDVGVGGEPAGDRSVLVADRDHPRQERPERPIAGAEGEGHLERLARGERRIPPVENLGKDRRIVGDGPAPAEERSRLRPGVVVPAAAAPVDVPVRPAHPAQDRDVIGQDLEFESLLPQGVPDPVAFGHEGPALVEVDQHAREAQGRPVRGAIDPPIGFEPVIVPVRPADAILVRIGAAPGDSRLDRRREAGLVVRMDRLDHLREAQAAAKAQAKAERAAKRKQD